MNWNNTLEGIVSSLSATFISFIITIFYKRIFSKKIKQNNSLNKEKISPFTISLFLTVFVVVLTFFSLIYNWTIFNYVYLFIADFVLIFVTYGIYNNQCPNCNRIFTKQLIDKQVTKEEKRPYSYRDCTMYLYADGSEKNRIYNGKERTKMETWRIEKEFYKCEKCNHEWSRLFERNLDENNRPKPNIIRVKDYPPSPI